MRGALHVPLAVQAEQARELHVDPGHQAHLAHDGEGAVHLVFVLVVQLGLGLGARRPLARHPLQMALGVPGGRLIRAGPQHLLLGRGALIADLPLLGRLLALLLQAERLQLRAITGQHRRLGLQARDREEIQMRSAHREGIPIVLGQPAQVGQVRLMVLGAAVDLDRGVDIVPGRQAVARRHRGDDPHQGGVVIPLALLGAQRR